MMMLTMSDPGVDHDDENDPFLKFQCKVSIFFFFLHTLRQIFCQFAAKKKANFYLNL